MLLRRERSRDLAELGSISKIVHHLGLSPPEPAEPPLAVLEVVRVPIDEQGREIEAPSVSRPRGPRDSLDRLSRRGVAYLRDDGLWHEDASRRSGD